MTTDTVQNFSLDVPKSDLKFFKTMAKKMGWTIRPKKKSGIDKALEDVKEGRVYKAKDADDLISQIDEKRYYAKIDHSIEQAENGEVIKQQDGENVEQFIDRLLCTK